MEAKRIRHACSRCRRQKLRCDYERPCPLCVRANADCTEATERTWRSNRPKSAVYRARHATQEQTQADDGQPSIQVQTRTRSRRESSVTTPVVVAAGTAGVPLLQSTSSSPATHAEQDDAVPPDQRASALHLVGKIFQKYHVASRTREVGAIPSSNSPDDGLTQVLFKMVPVVDIIGISLPPLDVVNALLDSYKDSVQWYISVLHEPSLRARLQPIMETGMASRKQRPLLLLALIVLIIGTQFISDDAREKRCDGVPLADLASNMLTAAERWYLPSMDSITVDTVAYSYLLSAFYMWNRQTRAAFITMGTTVRAAQFIGLNQEPDWGNIDAVERESRRFVWWSVFIGAGFISMSWGTPPMLSEADCNVGQPPDVEDTAEQCPGFASLEKLDDGERRPVTVGSYNRYKAEMYKIAVTIMRQVYFTQHHGPEELYRLISQLHQRLLAWEKSIPPELRLESHPPMTPENSHDASLRRKFALQALTLRVSYDNVQIFLFRPLISIGGIPRSHGCTRENSPVPVTQTGLESVPSWFIEIAQQQCWTSATRTSMVALRLDLLRLFQFGFPAIHVGVHAFSAGVMLGLLALLDPLSARGQESKRGIARIIQIPKATKLRSHVWSQMTQVLTDLMHVTAAEETKALIANPAGLGFSDVPTKPDIFGEPPDRYPEAVGILQNAGSSEPEVSIPINNGGRSSDGGIQRQPAPQALTLLADMADDGNIRQDAQTSSVLEHNMADMANHHPAQDHSQGDFFDMSEFWAAPQTGWPVGPMQGMDQSWMWDLSFPHH